MSNEVYLFKDDPEGKAVNDNYRKMDALFKRAFNLKFNSNGESLDEYNAVISEIESEMQDVRNMIQNYKRMIARSEKAIKESDTNTERLLEIRAAYIERDEEYKNIDELLGDLEESKINMLEIIRKCAEEKEHLINYLQYCKAKRKMV